ncbi:MAG: transforming growth factor-beta-induced protein, partial [Bradymonadia bacterium]
GLVGALTDPEAQLTVFAPTDDAFAALGQETIDALLADPEGLAEILTYHVVDGIQDAAAVVGARSFTTLNGLPIYVSVVGDAVFINDAQVLVTDVPASNGIIHAIDAVMLPTQGTIAQVASADGRFDTLVAALGAAGLVGAVADPDAELTVFAPTDDAFAALGQDTIDALLADPEGLAAILLYHVVAGIQDSGAVVAAESFETLNGAFINVRVDGDDVFINDAQVLIVDVPASNGIIHAIDAVLLPPEG